MPDKVLRAASRRRPAWLSRPARSTGRHRAARREPASVLHGIGALWPDDGPLLWSWASSTGFTAGHAYLLRELRRAAARLGAVPAVLTFDHHPDEIMAGAAPPLLCDPDERLVRLARAGVGVTIVQHFDEALRRTPYDAFVASIASRTALAGFLMTPDAAFGHERRGTPEALAALGAREGFSVVVVPPFDLAGRQVRSTEIRTAIATGDLATARALLGRRVAVTGEIVERPGRRPRGDAGVRGPCRAPTARAVPGRSSRRSRRAASRHARGGPSCGSARIGTLRVDARSGIPAGGRLRVSFVRPA